MQELLDKKSNLENELRTLEKQIYDLETNYIEETQNTGNFWSFRNFHRKHYQRLGRFPFKQER
jgi:hypothetical protein